MTTLVVDTDVASYIFREHPLAQHFLHLTTGHDLVLSFMTVAELEEWPLRNNWGKARRRRLADYIDRYRIVYVDRDLCRRFARTRADILGKGDPVETRDIWIAATALSLNAPVVTNNVKHFRLFSRLKILTAR